MLFLMDVLTWNFGAERNQKRKLLDRTQAYLTDCVVETSTRSELTYIKLISYLILDTWIACRNALHMSEQWLGKSFWLNIRFAKYSQAKSNPVSPDHVWIIRDPSTLLEHITYCLQYIKSGEWVQFILGQNSWSTI